MTDAIRDLIIIGGGIGGLSAAHAAQRLWRERGRPGRITVLEAGRRWGGVIASERRDGFLFEHGPDAVLTAKPAALDLMRELGLERAIIGTEPAARRACVARGRRLIPIPDGLYLFGPGRLWPFLWSPIVSLPGKLRMLLDLWIPPRADPGDESLGAFVCRRLGREALERLAQPLVGAIHSGDPDQLSLLATMPQFAAMEREHGGVIRALRARLAAGGTSTQGPRYGLFATLTQGMQGLIDALLANLTTCDLRLESPATGLARVAGMWRVRLADGSVLQSDAVIVALPAPAAARLVGDVDGELGKALAAISYRSITTVNIGLDATQAPTLPSIAGFVVPAVEHRAVLAATCASNKFAERAPPGRILIRAALPGSTGSGDARRDWATVRPDLATLLGVQGDPLVALSRRWDEALPDYRVGHGAHISAIRAREAGLPGLGLVGNAYEGTGIPDVIAGARAAVTRLLPIRHEVCV